MAACGMCSASNRKLHKRWYLNHKVYVCARCTIEHENILTADEKEFA